MLKVPKNIVAIDPIAEGDKVGSLYRPEQSKGRVKQGIVKYIGTEVSSVQIGDYVFFSGYAGIIFRLEGEGTLLFLPEDNIVAILSNRTTDISSLYFRDRDGNYFTANYEQALHLITQSMSVHFAKVEEPKDRKQAPHKTIKGKLFLIKDQEHMQSEDCFCQEMAQDYNRGKCPKCESRMHYASSKLWPISPIYHCESMTCKFNSLGI